MKTVKCKHEWKYFDEWDYPNGYEYEHVVVPHRQCKKCGRHQCLYDNYGERAKRWRNI